MAEAKILIDGYLITTATFTGPASDTTVTAGSDASIELSTVSISGAKAIEEIMGVIGVSGLPANVVIRGIAIDKDKVTLEIHNAGTSDVTVTAGSVTVKAIVMAY